jgi:hypothetical protein
VSDVVHRKVSEGVPCECGRGAVVGALTVRMGGAIEVQPLNWSGAVRRAADWRCRDCVVDALDVLGRAADDAYAAMQVMQPAPPDPCRRCGSNQWVAISINGGISCLAQCVPCGARGRRLGKDEPANGFVVAAPERGREGKTK